MLSNQSQKGGEGSTNLQSQQMVVHVGIDEKRAREIYQEMNLQLRNDYSNEAFNIANARIRDFENSLMPKMEAVDGALEAFADPSFQLLLVEAQKTAAASERPADYDLLSELLIHRFQKGEDRVARAGISRAVEIVDEISDEALLCLTVFHAVTSFLPTSGDIHQGLDVLEELFGKIIYRKLPSQTNWLDHLDILDAVRINSFGNIKKLHDYYSEALAGYTDTGIEKNSEDYNSAVKILEAAGLHQNLLVDHALNENFKRLNLINKEQIKNLTLSETILRDGKLLVVNGSLSSKRIDALESIYELYKKDEDVKRQNISVLMGEWDKRPNLRVLKEWWDTVHPAFQITSVGKVLAHSNAQRCDKSLPPLD